MFKDALHSLKESGLLRAPRTVESASGVRAVVDGRPCTLFCTNDYLGLSSHPKVLQAARDAMDEFGLGAGSASLIAGRTRLHAELEARLASFKRSESALLFGSGYLANAGLIPALAGEGDAIFSDRLNHASIIDGCRLSRATVHVYGHADPKSLEALLKDTRTAGRRWIVTEGVFGMDGDIAPMPRIMYLAKEYDAHVILDDAHATGVIGGTGRGTLEHFGLAPDGVVQMGTLGKAIGSYGAFAAASSDVAAWLVNRARSFMFSTALPPAACAAASAALSVIEDEPERLALLRRKAEMLRASLKALGLAFLGEGTPIIPVVMGDADSAVRLSSALLDKGFLAPAIRPPTVPDGMSRVRLTVSALHTEEDISGLVEAIKTLPLEGGGLGWWCRVSDA